MRTNVQADSRRAAMIDVVIARIWHGWTTQENANEYETVLMDEILPGIDRLDGHRGAYLLRRPAGGEVEFVTVTLWETLDAIRAFAGEDVERAVIAPGAGELLVRYDERSVHYDTVLEPSGE